MELACSSALVTGGASGIGAAPGARQFRRHRHTGPDRGPREYPLPLKYFERILRVNLIGTFNCLRLAASAMAKSDPVDEGSRGDVVNIASVAADDGQIGQAAYSASKAGVIGMTLTIARDLSAQGIRVNTIAPGLINTPIYDSHSQAEEFEAKLGQSVLFPHRLGTPDELASTVLECITNDYMNGETIRVDGGIRMPPR